MEKLIYHSIKRIPGILLVMLFMSSVMAQKPVWRLEVDQCETMEFSVVDMGHDRYTWDIYKDTTVNFAQEKGDMDPAAYFENAMYEGSTVQVNWLEPGTYMVRVMAWDEVNCTNNLELYLLDVVEARTEAQLLGDSLCIGEQAEVKIIFTGKGPWDVQFTYGDGTTYVNLNGIVDDEYTIPPEKLPPMSETMDFWIMEVTDQCTVKSYPDPDKIPVVVHPKPDISRIYVKDD